MNWCWLCPTSENGSWSAWTYSGCTATLTQQSALRHIQHLEFPKLQILNLQGNRIESIEGMSRMQMDQLEILYLCTRALSQMTTIFWQQLNWLQLDGPRWQRFRSVKVDLGRWKLVALDPATLPSPLAHSEVSVSGVEQLRSGDLPEHCRCPEAADSELEQSM